MTGRSSLADVARLVRTPRSWRAVLPRRPADLAFVVRLTAAGVVAYLLTLAWTDGAVDLTGALTALLVVQASAYSTVQMGIVRVGAVLTGVLIAVALSAWVGLTWWSLGAAIAMSLLLAKVLRLGEQALETPISAMLILGVGGAEVAVETRLVTTLIGAVVGMALNLLLPPSVPTGPAVDAVREVSEEEGACLRTASASISAGPITRAQAEDWLDQARGVSSLVATAATRVRDAKEVRRLNTRAIGAPDLEPTLRTALDALERSQLAIRALFQLMSKYAPEHETPDDGYGEDVRAAFAVVLDDVAECLTAFGALVQAETRGVDADVEHNLAESLEIVRETRAILTELLFVDARKETSLWLLRGSILTAVEEILDPLNVEDRARLRRQAATNQVSRLLTAAAPVMRELLPSGGAQRLRGYTRRQPPFSEDDPP